MDTSHTFRLSVPAVNKKCYSWNITEVMGIVSGLVQPKRLKLLRSYILANLSMLPTAKYLCVLSRDRTGAYSSY